MRACKTGQAMHRSARRNLPSTLGQGLPRMAGPQRSDRRHRINRMNAVAQQATRELLTPRIKIEIDAAMYSDIRTVTVSKYRRLLCFQPLPPSNLKEDVCIVLGRDHDANAHVNLKSAQQPWPYAATTMCWLSPPSYQSHSRSSDVN